MSQTSRKLHNELQETKAVKKKWLVFGGLLILFLALALMCSYSKDAKGEPGPAQVAPVAAGGIADHSVDASAPTCTTAELLDALRLANELFVYDPMPTSLTLEAQPSYPDQLRIQADRIERRERAAILIQAVLAACEEPT